MTTVSDEDLKSLKEEIAYYGNNCGGCETCSQIFGSRTQPEFYLPDLYSIICELIELRNKK